MTFEWIDEYPVYRLVAVDRSFYIPTSYRVLRRPANGRAPALTGENAMRFPSFEEAKKYCEVMVLMEPRDGT